LWLFDVVRMTKMKKKGYNLMTAGLPGRCLTARRLCENRKMLNNLLIFLDWIEGLKKDAKMKASFAGPDASVIAVNRIASVIEAWIC
jgi:hypothetical protein